MAQGDPGYYGAPRGGGVVPAKKSAENGCLIWGLAGCGLVLLIGVIGVMTAFSKLSKGEGGGLGGVMKNSISAQSCGQSMETVSAALEAYQVANKGKYPAKLADLVPKYLTDDATEICGGKVSELGKKLMYRVPQPKDADDAVVVEVFTGKSDFMMTSTTNYVRILKDGQVVVDQVTRQPVSGRRFSSQGGGNNE
jgi:hypothetical protein